MKSVKRILAIALCALTVLFAFSGCSGDISLTSNGKLKIEVVDDHASVVKYTDSTEVFEVVVPDEYEGVPVTEIADFGLFNAETVEVIKIGKNVEKIGEWSMTNNQHLKAFEVDEENPYFCDVDGILFTKDMKTIVYYPPARNIKFDKLSGEAQNKTTYDIPEGVETIRSKAFYKCYYVEDITVPSTVKRIEEKAFHRTAALNKIDLPEGLEYIGKDAFAYCFSENYKSDSRPELPEDTQIVIPSTVKEIGEYAFFNCEKVTKVTVNAKKDDMKLGKKWSPTTKGKEIKGCEIVWA